VWATSGKKEIKTDGSVTVQGNKAGNTVAENGVAVSRRASRNARSSSFAGSRSVLRPNTDLKTDSRREGGTAPECRQDIRGSYSRDRKASLSADRREKRSSECKSTDVRSKSKFKIDWIGVGVVGGFGIGVDVRAVIGPDKLGVGIKKDSRDMSIEKRTHRKSSRDRKHHVINAQSQIIEACVKNKRIENRKSINKNHGHEDLSGQCVQNLKVMSSNRDHKQKVVSKQLKTENVKKELDVLTNPLSIITGCGALDKNVAIIARNECTRRPSGTSSIDAGGISISDVSWKSLCSTDAQHHNDRRKISCETKIIAPPAQASLSRTESDKRSSNNSQLSSNKKVITFYKYLVAEFVYKYNRYQYIFRIFISMLCRIYTNCYTSALLIIINNDYDAFYYNLFN